MLVAIFFTTSSCVVLSRKSTDMIQSPEALAHYRNALEQSYLGKNGFQNAINLFNKADSIEPQNAIILHERGITKFNSKLDVKGAFIDLQRSIDYSTDEKDLYRRYHNRALCFKEIGDIKSACEDWSRAGRHGQSYIEKYCANISDTLFKKSPDNKVELKFELLDKSVKIRSTHNPATMSSCLANITLINNGYKEIKILHPKLDYGLGNDDCSLYLEAQTENGEKFLFVHNGTYSYFPTEDHITIAIGESHSQSQNISFLHQFPYPGIYKIRVAIKPSPLLKGIENTYYSNWEILEVKSNLN